MGKLLLILPALFLAVACETLRPAHSDARPGSGRYLYEVNCQKCHALYMPESYTAPEWRYFVAKYGRKARLSKDQRFLVFRYLEKHCAGSASTRQSR